MVVCILTLCLDRHVFILNGSVLSRWPKAVEDPGFFNVFQIQMLVRISTYGLGLKNVSCSLVDGGNEAVAVHRRCTDKWIDKRT